MTSPSSSSPSHALTPITVQAALDKMLDGLVSQNASQILPLDKALHHIAADTLTSPINLPRVANAAVDGYGLDRASYAQNPDGFFPVAAQIEAGHPHDGVIPAGAAVRIFTGAVMPDGPDFVMMHEDCTAQERDGRLYVRFDKAPKAQLNIRPAGENLHTGEMLIEAGTALRPEHMGQLAAAGIADLNVRPALTVALCSTGDEINEVGTALAPGQIYDSNRPMLASFIRQDGHHLLDLGIIKDDSASLADAFNQALQSADILICSGGASDGDKDYTQAILAEIGADILFWRLRMKPGRPMAAARLGQKMIFCLPGNPVAAYVCMTLLVQPVIDHMHGRTPRFARRIPLAAGFTHKKSPYRTEYLRVRLAQNAKGETQMQLHGRRGAGVISSLTGADGLVEIPEEITEVKEGDQLAFLPFQMLEHHIGVR